MSTPGTTEAGGATGTGGGGRAEPDPRVLAVWSPDWPVTAAARAAHVPGPPTACHADYYFLPGRAPEPGPGPLPVRGRPCGLLFGNIFF